jgi:hypothetical protein
VSHSYQTFFGFPRSDLNLDCGFYDYVITRFTSGGFSTFDPYARGAQSTLIWAMMFYNMAANFVLVQAGLVM